MSVWWPVCALILGPIMTDETTSQASSGTPVAPGTETVVPAPERDEANNRSGGFSPWLIIALLALGLAAWQWVETRQRLAETQLELAKRLAENDIVAGEARTLAKQAQEQLGVLQGKLGDVEGRLVESKSQQEVLESLYQNLARSNEESAIAEIEQSVTLASQQLQLAGNVQSAMLALQAADARLAGSNRPQFIQLRKVLTNDLDRLHALPQIDLPGIYLRLEKIIEAVDNLPLAASGRPREEHRNEETVEAAPPPTFFSSEYWQALAVGVWRELRGLIRIQRVDSADPVLLPPEQGFFLRENLKLRLLNARLALFSRDQWIFRNELHQCSAWIDRYFDTRDRDVQSAQQALKQLVATEIDVKLPSLNESLSAIKRFRAEKEHP